MQMLRLKYSFIYVDVAGTLFLWVCLEHSLGMVIVPPDNTAICSISSKTLSNSDSFDHVLLIVSRISFDVAAKCSKKFLVTDKYLPPPKLQIVWKEAMNSGSAILSINPWASTSAFVSQSVYPLLLLLNSYRSWKLFFLHFNFRPVFINFIDSSF